MYAFLSHESALEVLRTMSASVAEYPRWPQEPRELPRHDNTVTTQRMFKRYAAEVDLSSYGIAKGPVDLLVPQADQRSRGKQARFHTWKREVPPHAFVHLRDTLFASTPEFLLMQMATWQARQQPIVSAFSHELREAKEAYSWSGADGQPAYDDPFAWDKATRLVRLTVTMMELLGTYRLACASRGTSYRQPALMSFESLRELLSATPRAYGVNRLQQAMALAMPRSASPMETALSLMLSLPEAYGGFGLGKPELNRELPVRGHESLWAGGPVITPDLLWEDAHLVIEYDSDEQHGSVGPSRLASDAVRANVLTALGYSVMRVTTLNIKTLPDVEHLAQQVASGLGTELAKPDELLRIRRAKLHRLLMTQ